MDTARDGGRKQNFSNTLDKQTHSFSNTLEKRAFKGLEKMEAARNAICNVDDVLAGLTPFTLLGMTEQVGRIEKRKASLRLPPEAADASGETSPQVYALADGETDSENDVGLTPRDQSIKDTPRTSWWSQSREQSLPSTLDIRKATLGPAPRSPRRAVDQLSSVDEHPLSGQASQASGSSTPQLDMGSKHDNGSQARELPKSDFGVREKNVEQPDMDSKQNSESQLRARRRLFDDAHNADNLDGSTSGSSESESRACELVPRHVQPVQSSDDRVSTKSFLLFTFVFFFWGGVVVGTL